MTSITRDHLLTGDLAGTQPQRAEAYRVVLPPATASGPHLHQGGVVGYVEYGRIVYQPEGEPEQELTGGSAFFEPPGARVTRFDNPSATEPAAFIACYLLAGDQPLIESV